MNRHASSIVASRAAVLLGDRDAEPAQLGHHLVDLGAVALAIGVGEALALVAGAALAVAEIADRIDEVVLLVAESEVHERGAYK